MNTDGTVQLMTLLDVIADHVNEFSFNNYSVDHFQFCMNVYCGDLILLLRIIIRASVNAQNFYVCRICPKRPNFLWCDRRCQLATSKILGWGVSIRLFF